MLQVRLPSKVAKKIRVLGVENVFDCLDLCLPIKDGMASSLPSVLALPLFTYLP